MYSTPGMQYSHSSFLIRHICTQKSACNTLMMFCLDTSDTEQLWFALLHIHVHCSYHATLVREFEPRLSASKPPTAADAMSLVKSLLEWSLCISSFSLKCAGKVGWDGTSFLYVPVCMYLFMYVYKCSHRNKHALQVRNTQP
jgi:hypothetical protein